MIVQLRSVSDQLSEIVRGIEAATLEPGFAVELVTVFAQIEKSAAAGKAISAERVASSGTWRTWGDRSPAHFISKKTGDSVGACVTAIETAKRMAELPKADDAFRSGKLTAPQAAEIASAA
ncbi:MAG: hypothetical protein ABIS18_02580, partial [Actinomycetota bacterium]